MPRIPQQTRLSKIDIKIHGHIIILYLIHVAKCSAVSPSSHKKSSIRKKSKTITQSTMPTMTLSSFTDFLETRLRKQKGKTRTTTVLDDTNSSREMDKGHNNNTQQSKKVRFSRVKQVRRFRRNQDIDDEEASRVWYSEEELQQIRGACVFTIQCMCRTSEEEWLSTLLDEVQYSARGLEYKVPKVARIRAEIKHTSRLAVSDEQLEQWRLGVKNAGRIADRYLHATLESTRNAHLRGLKDEKEALMVLASPPACC
jgi:hypothetical protein